VEQQVADVTGGQVYRLDACLTVTKPGLTNVALRIVWYAEQNGYGSSLLVEDTPANPGLVGGEQCLSLPGADAHCAARSARYGVIAVADNTAVTVSSLQFSIDPAGTPFACATPTAAATATATPTPSPTPVPSSTPRPTAGSTPSPQAAAEPDFFPSLANGGFEELRADGTPSSTIVKIRRACVVFRWPIEGCTSPHPNTLRRTWRGMDSVAALGADGHAGQ